MDIGVSIEATRLQLFTGLPLERLICLIIGFFTEYD